MTTLLKSPHAEQDARPRPGAGQNPRLSAFGPTTHQPTASFEAAFRDRLRQLADGVEREGTPRRAEITAICTALRSAVDPDSVLRVARGLTADWLWHAYRHVECRRAGAQSALDAFLADPTPERLQSDGRSIALLLPGPHADLVTIASREPHRLTEAASNLAGWIRRLDRSVEEIESRLDAGGSRILAASLDDGWQGGLFHESVYRPKRVGAVMPARLAVLLGESPGETV